MNIVVVGAGYVGLPTAACLADTGLFVTCCDLNSDRISRLSDAQVDLYEESLESLIVRNLQAGRLFFSTEIPQKSDAYFITVGTPPLPNGEADSSAVFAVAEKIARNFVGNELIIVIKSTVPIGTTDEIQERIQSILTQRGQTCTAHVAFCPEFLRQGTAVKDTLRPDRIVIGTQSAFAFATIKRIYADFSRNHDRFLQMDSRSAEMVKYAANCMLAMRISYMNEIALISEQVGADIELVRQGVGADPRIGYSFLYSGIGYGGSCFPKDISALIQIGKRNNVETIMLQACEERNSSQQHKFVQKITRVFGEDLSARKFCIWGVTFKPGTNDLRCAPSLVIAQELLKRGASLQINDPVAHDAFLSQIEKQFSHKVSGNKDLYEAADGCDALLLLTEWKCYRNPDFKKLSQKLKGKDIFDGRNIYVRSEVNAHHFYYHGIGR